jgi:hypothetical protein
MKAAFKVIILFVLTFYFNAGLIAREDKYPETVIIKLIEYHEGTIMVDNSKLIIIKPDNTIETKELDKAKIKGDGEGITANLVKLRQELQKWHNNGFVVKSSSSSFPIGGYVSMTIIILQKN